MPAPTTDASTPPGKGIPGEPPRSHQNNFNFLRLALATMVIAAHSPELIDGDRGREPLTRLFGINMSLGTLAVDGFFLLSGYLIARSWNREPRLGPYLAKRALRIVPGFAVASIVSAFVFGPMGGNPSYWADFPWGRFLRGMATLDVPQVSACFDGLAYPMVNGPIWTIRFEFLCYILLGLLGLAGVLGRRYLLLGAYTACHLFYLGQCVTRSLDYVSPHELVNIALRVPSLLCFFLAGSCFALFGDRVRYSGRGALVAGALLIPAMARFTTAQAALPILGGYLLFAAAFAPSRALRAFGRGPDVSYGVYLYAWPIQTAIIYHQRHVDPYLLSIVTLAMAGALGTLSWYLVEKPFLGLKPRPGPREPAPAPAPARAEAGLGPLPLPSSR